MKTITICCEHTNDIHLKVNPENIGKGQGDFMQVVLTHAQAARVRRHCHCMLPKMKYARQYDQGDAWLLIHRDQIE
jgi:hypothetical protein